MTDIVVVGAGLYGLTVARELAERDIRVTVIEQRSHIGGNAYSEIDQDTGIEVHAYGSHIFHTSNEIVWEYVNRFSSWTPYEHRVWSTFRNRVYPMPINLATINQFFETDLNPLGAHELIAREALEISNEPTNLEEKAISLIGRSLYEAFIKGYTFKQWQTDPRLLPADIITRLPVRYNYDNRYFNDTHQALPTIGYTGWMLNIADHPNISFEINTDFLAKKNDFVGQVPVLFTGPLDKYFNYEYGKLGWRTLDFEIEALDIDDYQGTSVMNFADESIPYTRIHEFKHFRPDRPVRDKTIIAREFSRYSDTDDEDYYPINSATDRAAIKSYRELVVAEKDVWFGGRLGSYKYLDMHMAIAAALTSVNNEIAPSLGI